MVPPRRGGVTHPGHTARVILPCPQTLDPPTGLASGLQGCRMSLLTAASEQGWPRGCNYVSQCLQT